MNHASMIHRSTAPHCGETFRFIIKNLDAKAVFQSKKLHLYAKINQAESGQSNLLEF